MHESVLLGLASVLSAGLAAQWLAWRLRLPSILLMLGFGVIAGPVTGFIDPDRLLGLPLLLAVVSISVGVILFEGGLTLRFAELASGQTVARLVTIGAAVTWCVAALAARWILGLPWSMAILMGAILIVSGPTVILPLLRHVRPTASVESILKWEGIAIDPVGATMALLVFESIFTPNLNAASTIAVTGVIKTLVVGVAFGAVGAGLFLLALRNYWIPDYLHSPMALMLVIVVLTGSNLIQKESGLLSVTLMGMIMANQRWVSVRHVMEFKRDLTMVLVGSLFILLAARLRPEDLNELTWQAALFLAVMVFVARPAAVYLSTVGSKLPRRERLFLACLAPRGIVAAAVSAVFALRLSDADYPDAQRLAPLVFLMIVGTVTIYGLAAGPIARALKLAESNPQGILIVGAHEGVRKIAKSLVEEEYRVLLLDKNWQNVSAARLAGLTADAVDILSYEALSHLNLAGIGRMMAMTSNDEVNSLAVFQCKELFDGSELYQLAPSTDGIKTKGSPSPHLRGRLLFGRDVTYARLDELFEQGATIKKTKITAEFNYEDYQRRHGLDSVPMFVIENDRLTVLTTDRPLVPRAGQLLVSLVTPDVEPKAEPAAS